MRRQERRARRETGGLDWFDRQAAELWEKHLIPHKSGINKYLEIGVADGRSMEWVLENLEPTRAVGVDPYWHRKESEKAKLEKYQERAKQKLARHLETKRLVLYRVASLRYLCRELHVDDQRFDLIYVDGDHRSRQCMLDLALSFELLNPGGRIVVDDMNRTFVNGRVQTYFAAKSFEFLWRDWMVREWEEGRQICFRKR